MSVREQLASGDLESAVAEAMDAVRAKPTDSDARYRLFALLTFTGDLHRARKQLEALDVGDPDLLRVKSVYINLLAAEQERRAVFQHDASPLLPPDPPAHLASRLEALAALRSGDAEAVEIFTRAVTEQPDLAGTVNGQPLAALRDLDDVLGSVLEVFAGGRYLWLPWERIQGLETAAPSHLLDLLWLPAEVTDIHGATSSVHLPVLYEGSSEGEDPRERTGAATGWVTASEGIDRGCGQRLLAFATPDGEVQELPILELRSLVLGS